MQSQRVDGVSLVVGLPGTGSDPPPTAEREMLLSEMQRQEVDKPNSVLASTTTALVRVRGLIPPGAKKGDRFDIDVAAPDDSGTSDLAGGWLMESRLHEYASINGKIAEGHLLALAQGDLLTAAVLEQAVDEVSKTRGVVLGGGVVLKSRGFGLMVKDDFASVQTSSRIGEAINARFDLYRKGQKRGVAEPKSDSYVELLVHPKYEDNVIRYMRVIQNIAIRESGQQRSSRLSQLRAELAQPSTAALAAIKLEGLGADGIPVLREALNSGDAEIQFYAAESLAYQDEPDAVQVLGDAARQEPAFRFRALAALGVLDSVAAHEELVDLMNESSAETRYGAFRVLRKQTPFDPILGARLVGDKFTIHQVNTAGPPLIHVSRQERAEIVFFGSDHHFSEPLVLFVGKDIVVRSAEPGRCAVRRLTVGEDDEQRIVSTKVADVLEEVVELGATYAEVVQALNESKRTGSLASRLEFSAIPDTGRVFSRDKAKPSEDASTQQSDQLTADQPDELDTADSKDWLTIDPNDLQATQHGKSGNPAVLRRESGQPGDPSAIQSDASASDDNPRGPQARSGVDHKAGVGSKGARKVTEQSPVIDEPSASAEQVIDHAGMQPLVAATSLRTDAGLPPYLSGRDSASEPWGRGPSPPVESSSAGSAGAETSMTSVGPPVACVPRQQRTLPTRLVAAPTTQTHLQNGSPPRADSQFAAQSVPPADSACSQVSPQTGSLPVPPRNVPPAYSVWPASAPVATAETVHQVLPASTLDADTGQNGGPSWLPAALAQAPATAGARAANIPAVAGKRIGSPAAPPAKSKSPMPPAPERVLPGVDLLDLIDSAAPRRRF